MSQGRREASWPADLEDALSVVAERRGLGRPDLIEGSPVAAGSAHSTYKVVLRFGDGTRSAWFAKDLGSRSRAVEDARVRRHREPSVYRHLLRGADLGTAEFLGEHVGKRATHWLILDFVEGTPLEWLGFDWWLAAVRWLGRKDGHFQGLDWAPTAGRWLTDMDSGYFREVGRKAERAIRRVLPDLSERLGAVLRYYEGILDDLVPSRPTLVHGIFRPSQILVQTESNPPRICPVDWESAASGSLVYDFASLTNGFVGDELARLVAAYRDSALEHGADVPDTETFLRALHATWTYRSLRRIQKSIRREWEVDDTRRFLSEGEAHVRRHAELSGCS